MRDVTKAAERGKKIIRTPENDDLDILSGEIQTIRDLKDPWEIITTAFFFGVAVGTTVNDR